MAAESLGLSHTGPLSIVPSVPPAQDAPPSQAHACTAEPCAEGAVPGVVREAIRKAVQGAVQEATPGAVPAEQRRCPACGGAQVVSTALSARPPGSGCSGTSVRPAGGPSAPTRALLRTGSGSRSSGGR